MAKDVHYTQHGREITKSGICTVSGKLYQVTMTVGQFRMWQDGVKLQNVLPYLSPEQCEFWISSTTPDEWCKLFPVPAQ